MDRSASKSLTGIELLARAGESAPVMHLHVIALLSLALAVDLDRHIDLELLSGGNHANSGRGKGGDEEGSSHCGGSGVKDVGCVVLGVAECVDDDCCRRCVVQVGGGALS